MIVLYNSADITGHVDVRKCIYNDVSGGRRDLLDIEFEYSEKWFGWKPVQDDTIRIVLDGLDTGILYVNTVLPEVGRFRIIATGAKSAARRAATASFEDATLGSIMRMCAGECGMDQGLYGISAACAYPYMIRENETCTAFIDRLMIMESGRLKCMNGKLRGIGIEYAQSQTATQCIDLDSTQLQASYQRRTDMKYKGVTVISPYAKASAYDLAADGNNHPVITTLPAADGAQAKRWAQGLLLNHNRYAEELNIGMELNAGLTALARIDINSNTDAEGEWVVDEVEHDLIEKKSTSRLLRSITTIR